MLCFPLMFSAAAADFALSSKNSKPPHTTAPPAAEESVSSLTPCVSCLQLLVWLFLVPRPRYHSSIGVPRNPSGTSLTFSVPPALCRRKGREGGRRRPARVGNEEGPATGGGKEKSRSSFARVCRGDIAVGPPKLWCDLRVAPVFHCPATFVALLPVSGVRVLRPCLVGSLFYIIHHRVRVKTRKKKRAAHLIFVSRRHFVVCLCSHRSDLAQQNGR